ncbi:hypothetical protein MA16_Dca018891 [Dendrobium catenatum]|uniref:Uncharacterized protein n=1 Tax=Dendrobium catenatum TaxID=906689 RepID=A0A2I0VVZ9_9ASPA|nr:hypothetical protein MA16_Dca018891 [Dendrobium catenatum]
MSSFARLEHRTDEDPNVIAMISFLLASVSGGALFLEMEVNFHAGLMKLGMRSNALFICSNCKRLFLGAIVYMKLHAIYLIECLRDVLYPE